jgi:sugar phosphate isomerase/epimerase
LPVIEKIGAKTCEVFLSTFSEYTPSYVETVAKNKGDIQVYSIHTLNQQFEPELFNPVKKTREDCEFFFKQAAYGAKVLGAKYYTFHGPGRIKRIPYNIDFASFGARLAQLDEMLQEYGGGCRLTYENVHWAFFNYPEFFTLLRRQVEIKACLDIKQAMQSKISYFDYLDAIGADLANVHLCDFYDDGSLCLPGRGSVDFVQLFRRLGEAGYSGPLMIEVYANNFKEYSEIKECFDYLTDCLYRAVNGG